MEYIPYREHSGWAGNLERVLNELRREWVSPGRVSVLLPRRPNEPEAKVLTRLGIEPLDDETVPKLGSSALTHTTWSTASGRPAQSKRPGPSPSRPRPKPSCDAFSVLHSVCR